MIIRHSVFKSDPWGDGGARRTAQVSELLANGLETASFLQWSRSGGRLIGRASLSAITFIRRTGFPSHLRADFLRVVGSDLQTFRGQIASLPPGTVLVWEGTQSRFATLPMLAREHGVRVIGLPHNLESLVPGTRSFYTDRPAPLWLEEEMRSLAACDAVFAISREDQWLLRLHGIPAGYLPYYPSKEVEGFLLNIAAARRSLVPEGDLLLMGTAANKPTCAGMLDRIKFFAGNRHLFSRLHVVGYGTERLRDAATGIDGVYLHGAVDSSVLRGLLLVARAAVVHQQATSGVLTRVSELLLAGVPVLANSDAARSFFGVPGVHVYEDDTQLAELLGGELSIGVSPSRPVVCERMFMDVIRSLDSAGRG